MYTRNRFHTFWWPRLTARMAEAGAKGDCCAAGAMGVIRTGLSRNSPTQCAFLCELITNKTAADAAEKLAIRVASCLRNAIT